MNKTPLISFCIATYKRKEFLRKTILSILNQNYNNVEIIISDNDSKGSAESIAKSFHSNKIKYYKNKINIGMVKNFNKALSFANGDFVTFVADDDPVSNEMLRTLIKLYRQYPDANSFFGASSVNIVDNKIAKLYGFKMGINSLQSKLKEKNEITIYKPNNFLKEFLNYNVVSYFLWSSGFVRTSLVRKIGGMPDYNSPFLTDYTYICLIGSLGKMVVINKPLAVQTLHENNFGREMKNITTLPYALNGFYNLLNPYIRKYNLKHSCETFISNWTIDHIIDTLNFSNKIGKNIDKNDLINIYYSIEKNFPFFKTREFEFKSKLYYPAIFLPFWKLISRIKRKFRYVMNKS